MSCEIEAIQPRGHVLLCEVVETGVVEVVVEVSGVTVVVGVVGELVVVLVVEALVVVEVVVVTEDWRNDSQGF